MVYKYEVGEFFEIYRRQYIYKEEIIFMRMNRRGAFALGFSFFVVLAFMVWIFVFFAFYKTPGLEQSYLNSDIRNPITGFSIEQASNSVDESFVYYLLYNFKAYNLHNPPLSKDNPKIEIMVDDAFYNAVIKSGEIVVSKGEIKDEDITIRTTSNEMVKMMNNKDYAKLSFSSGSSQIVVMNSKSILLAKGYLNLYSEITGSGITGNVIRMFSG